MRRKKKASDTSFVPSKPSLGVIFSFVCAFILQGILYPMRRKKKSFAYFSFQIEDLNKPCLLYPLIEEKGHKKHRIQAARSAKPLSFPSQGIRSGPSKRYVVSWPFLCEGKNKSFAYFSRSLLLRRKKEKLVVSFKSTKKIRLR